MASLGERLKSLREAKSLTQEELAEELGLTKQAVSHYERGIRMPDLETLTALGDLFNVSTDFLLGKSDYTTRLLDEKDLALVDGYYTNPETAAIAQEIFENKGLRTLFDAVRTASPQELDAIKNMFLTLKAAEGYDGDDPA